MLTSAIEMKVLLLASLLAASAILASGEQKRYDGYQVYKVTAKDNMGFKALSKLQETTEIFDFWTEPSMYRSTDIMVPPGKSHELLQVINAFGMSYEIKIEDVQRLIDSNRRAPRVPQHPRRSELSDRSARYVHNWTDYSDLATIEDFLKELAANHPDLVTLKSIGKSVEGRDQWSLKISRTGSSNKNALFIDGGIHAREWISPATVTYALSQLVENNDEHPELLDGLDWYFVPVINPDGYVYTQTDRLWRKNRNPNGGNCFGVDLNRNFGYHWAEGGTSTVPCSDLYHGASAFSEVESQNLRNFILEAAAAGAKAYLTFHSYGEDMIYPWSYQNSTLPDDSVALDALAKKATDALTAVYGTKYGVGNSYQLYGATAGSSDDWSKGVAGIPFAYTVELRDQGRYGFELPANQILPTATETWELIKVVALDIKNRK